MARIKGSSGNDVVNGTSESDDVKAQNGDDVLIYRFSENAGADDVYTGGAGIDAVRLELTGVEWANPAIVSQVAAYYAHLTSVRRNPHGEVSNGSSGDFTFDFGDRTLTVESMERMEVFVDGVQVANLDQPVVYSATTTGAVVEDGTFDANPATHEWTFGTISFFDLDATDSHTVTVSMPVRPLGGLIAGIIDAATGDAFGTAGWAFVLDNAAAQGLAAGQTHDETFTVRIADANAAGNFVDTDVVISIAGANDAVIITSAAQSGAVVEDANFTPSPDDSRVAFGMIRFDDVDLIDTHTRSFVKLESGAPLGTFALAGITEGPATTHGSMAWSYVLDNAAAQSLAEGQTLSETYRVTMDDGHGSSAAQDVVITIAGTNDAPFIRSGPQSGAATEIADNAPGENATLHSAAGVMTFTDLDTLDVHGASVAPQDGGAGYRGAFVLGGVDQTANSVGWSFEVADAALDDLQAGQVLTQRYDVTIEDGHGGTSTQTVTIAITGANDAVIITSAAQSGAVVEDANFTPSPDDSRVAFGMIRFDDVDLIDVHTRSFVKLESGAPLGTFALAGITESPATTHGSMAWSYVLDNAAAQSLGQSETRVETYRVTIDDGHGSSAAQDVVITIAGTNDAPLIRTGPQSGAATEVADNAPGENATLHSAAGVMTFTDLDTLDVHGASVAPQDGGAGYRGAFVLGGVDQTANSVGWSFEIADAALDDLQAGQVLTQRYDIAVEDGHGGTSAQTVTITITGANDAPLAAADAYFMDEDSTLTVAAAGVLANDSDVDGDALNAVLVTGPAHGDVTLNPDGSFSYTPDADYFGADSFTYTANDGRDDSNAVTVDINVADVPDGVVVGTGSVIVGVPPGATLSHFMRVEGVTQDWVELDAFSWGVHSTGASGGGKAGSAVREDVMATLGSSPALVTLLTHAGTGKHLKSVEIETYAEDADGSRLVEEFRFEDVVVSELNASAGSPTRYDVAFDYVELGRAAVVQDLAGAKDDVVSTGFDYGLNKIVAGPNGVEGAAKGKQQATVSELDYYVRFEGVGGGEWLRLDAFALTLDSRANATSKDGKAAIFAASDAALLLGSTPHVVELTDLVATGKHIKSVEVEAYVSDADGARLVNEYRFEDVLLSGLHTNDTTFNMVNLNFAKVLHGSVVYDDSGVQTDTVSTGYDFAQAKSTTGKTPVADVFKGTIADIIAPGEDLSYFMRIDGLTEDWVELDAFSWGISATPASGGSGLGSSQLAPRDVTVTLGSNPTLVELLQFAGKGTHLKFVEIEAYAFGAGTDGGRLIEEFRFDDVVVSALLADAASPTRYDVAFAYSMFGRTAIAYDDKGAKDHEVGMGSSVMESKTSSVPAGDAEALKGKQEPTLSDLDYYVRIDGVGKPGEWLRLDAFGLGLDVAVDFTSKGGGAAGRLEASPAVLLLGSSPHVVELTELAVTGEHVKTVEVEAYAPGAGGEPPRLIDEYRFTDVTFAGLHTADTTLNTLSLAFSKINHGQVIYDAAGNEDGAIAEAFDFAANKQNDGDLPVADAGKMGPADSIPPASHLKYFMRVDDVTSDWVELDGFSWGVAGTTPGGGGGGGGKVVPQDATAMLGSGAPLVKLLESASKSKHLKFVEIEAYADGGDNGDRLVEEFRFEDVIVSGITAFGGPVTQYGLAFHYGRFGRTAIVYDMKGGKDDEVSTGFDFLTNKIAGAPPGDAHALKAKQDSTVSDLDYYVRFDGVGKAGEWLQLESFGFTLAATNTVSTSKLDAGKLTATDVMLLMGSSPQLVELTQFVNTGKHIKIAEVEAYETSADGPRLVDEYRFHDVTLNDLRTSNSTQNVLTFDFSKFTHGHVLYDDAGAKTDALSAGFDFMLNKADSGPLPVPDIGFP
ncbi:MAG TPA: VCBS domain-containing protein [Burkholderiales bacterium]|nr:VCBS domain-containing protein [Burkholderiales bacterium]